MIPDSPRWTVDNKYVYLHLFREITLTSEFPLWIGIAVWFDAVRCGSGDRATIFFIHAPTISSTSMALLLNKTRPYTRGLSHQFGLQLELRKQWVDSGSSFG